MSEISDAEFYRICSEVDTLVCIYLANLLQEKLPGENHYGATMLVLTRMLAKAAYRISSQKQEQHDMVDKFADGVKKMLENVKDVTIQ